MVTEEVCKWCSGIMVVDWGSFTALAGVREHYVTRHPRRFARIGKTIRVDQPPTHKQQDRT